MIKIQYVLPVKCYNCLNVVYGICIINALVFLLLKKEEVTVTHTRSLKFGEGLKQMKIFV